MVTVDRQAIIESNRSLRNIKNELENLLEKGVIDDNTFESITSTLPPESSLSGPLRTSANSSSFTATTTTTAATAAAVSPPQPCPSQALQNLTLNSTPPPPPQQQQQQQQPPSYNDTPAPILPARSAAAAEKPIIAHARALYRYTPSDARDLHLEKDDVVAVYEYMNNDWWMGRNQRTTQQGIFPQSYVLIDHHLNNNKAAPYQQQQQQQYGYGYPPQQQNPYDASAPPMAIAQHDGQHQQQQQQGEGGVGGKAGEYGKKFGKKLGNAAIFGAGASIGSNIVNSIF